MEESPMNTVHSCLYQHKDRQEKRRHEWSIPCFPQTGNELKTHIVHHKLCRKRNEHKDKLLYFAAVVRKLL